MVNNYTSKTYNTKSRYKDIESVTFSPVKKVNYNKISVGDIVDVYIDSNNPEIYWVDIDFLFDN